MDWELAYQIVLGLGLILVGAWSFDARRLRTRILRLMQMQDGPPTEEIELPPTMKISPRLEEFGPGKPLPDQGFYDLLGEQRRAKGYRNSW
jgi:hypothetical protein